jgi:DNA-binding response OmpR family regulator
VSADATLPIAPPAIAVRDSARRLRLDPRHRTADAGNGEVQLSNREFLLLEHLSRREGETCTRAELLDCVWGFWFDTGTNVVDVYVCRLRAKLGPRMIETVRNVGYTLAPGTPDAERTVNGGGGE